ncbi:MAG: LCP family protein, partial [Clostridia bacterium]|nr:LCP family protein [Clostridia bacterium]
MLCSFDTVKGNVNVMQIPRDIYVVDELCPAGGKINNVFSLAARDYREQNPDATADAEFEYAMGYLCDKIGDLFAVPVDFYVSFNTLMYRELLEIVCPITVDVPFDMDYDDPTQDLHIHLKAGVQQLDPEQAEGFSRFRQNNGGHSGLPEGDFSRVDLQKITLAAIAEKFFSNFSLPSAHALAGTVWNNLDTDLEMNECIWFLQQALTLYTEGTMTLDSIRMYDLPCKVPSPAECAALLGVNYTVSYGFMETSLGYTLEILNKAFNTKDTPITAEMLGYVEAVEIGGYCDHSDTEGQSLQGILDNPPDVWISHY